MAFDSIRTGDTDAFQFDLTAWFPNGIDDEVVLASQPPGWTFSDQSVTGSVVSAYATAPGTTGYSTLLCTATDGTPRRLTKEERILVVP